MMGDNPEIGHPIFFHKTGADQQILVNAEVDGERVKRGICRPRCFPNVPFPFQMRMIDIGFFPVYVQPQKVMVAHQNSERFLQHPDSDALVQSQQKRLIIAAGPGELMGKKPLPDWCDRDLSLTQPLFRQRYGGDNIPCHFRQNRVDQDIPHAELKPLLL